MAQDYKQDQGTITPTIFIGMGGVGSRIVDRISKRAHSLPNWDSQLNPLMKFVSIDTNEGDQHNLKNIPQGNRLNIAAFDKSQVLENFKRSEEEQAWQWLDKAYKPRAGIKPGAGQIRIESRFGFFNYSQSIYTQLKSLVESTLSPGITWRQNTPPKINVYLFSTLAGGTGSGCFLSVAYLVSHLIKAQGWQPRLISNLLLSTLILDKVGSELHSDIHANTYAALKELEYMTKLDYSKVKAMGRDQEEFVFLRNEDRNRITTVNHRPFFLTFIYDQPKHLSLSRSDEAIADTAFLQIFTPIAADMAGELDNYEKNLEDLTHLPGKFRHVSLGYAKNYGACGAAAMVIPGLDLLEYCILKFSAQAIRDQITFGQDKNSNKQNDERLIALTRLAIDYSDPKFLKMSDDEREKVINKSFVDSVKELKRQDEQDGLQGGFWQQLVESTEEGIVNGHDEKGEPIRSETTLEKINRLLLETAKKSMNKVSIKDRNLKVINPESVGQYKDHISRFKEDVRKANILIDQELDLIIRPVADGDMINALSLNPITERYLVINLLKLCSEEWIPKAEKKIKEAALSDIANDAIKKRLEEDNYQSLLNNAEKKGFAFFQRVDEDAFNRVKDQVQNDLSTAVNAATNHLEAKIHLHQCRSLVAYLTARSRQFLRIATKMDSLVNELETRAEAYRKEQMAVDVLPTLRVEIFKTLDEPTHRIWNEVYQELFIRNGKYLSTFDRNTLATTISNELKPRVMEDGRIQEKTPDEVVKDLRESLYKLGEQRMKTTIFGGDGKIGLNILNALELEAKIVLTDSSSTTESISDEAIKNYKKTKVKALAQISGVLARVNAAEATSLDDGVIVNQTRLVVSDLGSNTSAGNDFMKDIKDILSNGQVQVKEKQWYDPHLLIVHDIVTPIPLYYFNPVVNEVEAAYIKKSTDKNRSYHLHTDFRWEKTLPNLNPLRSEIAVDWSFDLFVKALLVKIIYSPNQKQWMLDLGLGKKDIQVIGESLAEATYRLGEMYQSASLKELLDKKIRETLELMEPALITSKLDKMTKQFVDVRTRVEMKDATGKATREDLLDGPVWFALNEAAEKIKKSYGEGDGHEDEELHDSGFFSKNG